MAGIEAECLGVPGNSDSSSLCEALDRLLAVGVAAEGDLALTLADVELVRISLRLVAASSDTYDGPVLPWSIDRRPTPPEAPRRVLEPTTAAAADSSRVPHEPSPTSAQPESAPRITPTKPGDPKKSLARLVLTLARLIHELMERQAARRFEKGTLTDAEVERLGLALEAQTRELRDLARRLDLDEKDLNLDLGPLGRLL